MKARVLKQIARHSDRLDRENASKLARMERDMRIEFIRQHGTTVVGHKEPRVLSCYQRLDTYLFGRWDDLRIEKCLGKLKMSEPLERQVRSEIARTLADAIAKDDRVLELIVQEDPLNGYFVRGQMEVLVTTERLRITTEDGGRTYRYETVKT